MDGVLQRFGDEFRRNPVEFMNSAVVKVADYLVAHSKFFRDNLQRQEALVATDLDLKNARRIDIAVRKLHGIVRKVREYVELVEGLSGMAND
jgi:uncharacterized protein YigA (DUF484 family)